MSDRDQNREIFKNSADEGGRNVKATHFENLINTNVKRISMGPPVPENRESFVLLRFNNEKERNNFLQTDAGELFNKEATSVDKFNLGKTTFSVKIKVDEEQYRQIQEYKTGVIKDLTEKLFPKAVELTNAKFLGSAIDKEKTVRKCLVNRNFSIAAKIGRNEKGYEEFQKNMEKMLQKANEGNKFDSKLFERKLNIYVGQFTKDVGKVQPNTKDIRTLQDISFQQHQLMARNPDEMKRVDQYDKIPEGFVRVDKGAETIRKYNSLVYSSTDIRRIIIDRIPQALSSGVNNDGDRKNFFNKDPKNCVSFVFKSYEEAKIFSANVKDGKYREGDKTFHNKIKNSIYTYQDEAPNPDPKKNPVKLLSSWYTLTTIIKVLFKQ